MHYLTLAAVLAVTLAPSAAAQVGHDPARSPYRTLRYGQFVGVNGGYFRGDGGQIGVAPHNGGTIGLRYDFLGAGTISIGLAADSVVAANSACLRRPYFASYSARACVIIWTTTLNIRRTERIASSLPAIG